MAITMSVPGVGFARESPARRRSQGLWAPPHNIFLLKNIAPAFESALKRAKEEGVHTLGELFLSRAQSMYPLFFCSTRGGIRTHKALRPRHFKCRAYNRSATRAFTSALQCYNKYRVLTNKNYPQQKTALINYYHIYMNNTLDAGVDAVGVLLGIIFIILYMRAARSLVGSAFKTYHQWMTVGATLFTFSFLADYASLISGGIFLVNVVHDVLLLSSVVVFIATNLRLPHEANKYLNMKARERIPNN